MLLKINPEVFSNFPDVRIAVISAINVRNSVDNKDVQALLLKQQEALRKAFARRSLTDHPYLEVWRQAYKKFGANPKEYLSSVENLSQRVMKDKPIRSINSLVDLYNYISLKYLLPLGGEDLDTIIGDIELAQATDHEKPALLLGEAEPKKPQPGEIFYKDEDGAICRRWNWKEADRTKLTPQTQNAVLVLEALPPVASEVLEAAVSELALLIERYCGGTVTLDFIQKSHPEIQLKKNAQYVPLAKKPMRVEQSLNIYEIQPAITEAEQEKQVTVEHENRVKKVKRMRDAGIEPWPNGMQVDTTCKEVVDTFSPEKENTVYDIAGRILTLRLHGKTAFAHIQDRSGRLQIYVRSDVVGDDKFDFFKHMLDIGDIIWVQGTPFLTKTGEITLKVTDFKLQSKCLYPLPEKFHGLTDVETRYRQRYLDLITNPESKEKFVKRTAILQTLRDFLNQHDFVEVETPMLHPIPGGAAARPFITHHNAYDMNLYLRIAPELYLKRLVVGGLERVYEINRNFRNEGVSTRHNPEFTMLEFYMAYHDFHYIMDFVEQMFRKAAMNANKSYQILYGEHDIDFEKPFDRITPRQAVVKYGGVLEEELNDDLIDATMARYGVSAPKDSSTGMKIFAMYEALAESKLIQPTFIIDYPIEISPLSKRDAENPYVAARFELFIAGMEVANGFNELNDPFDQAERFKDQARQLSGGNVEAMHYDADYVHALEYGLPPTVGVGVGIDRLTMLLTNTTSIKDVILFPTMKMKSE